MELKAQMTYDEMAQHFIENTYKRASKVTVGLYAKSLGYYVYKPMINGKVVLYYINEKMGNKRQTRW